MYFKEIIKQFENTERILELNLTNTEHLYKIQKLADTIYKESKSLDEIIALETDMLNDKNNFSLTSHLAVKIAKSKQILSEIKEKIHLTIIFSVYKDKNRLLTKEEHPQGEDFLLKKIQQIESLTSDFNNISWDMLIVDDGCPENSGKVASEILNEKYNENNVEVLFLQDAIDQKLEVVKNLKSTGDSIKGGAIEYGMWYAVNKNIKNHIIISTSANLNTHLGQSGLLINSIINNNKKVAIASRTEPESIVKNDITRDLNRKLFIYLWKRVINRLNYIIDTQCDFKAYKSETIKKIILNNYEYKLAYNFELLLKTDILERRSIEVVPIAWINNTKTIEDNKQYIDMLKAITKMYHKYLPAHADAHLFAFFIKALTQKEWDILIEHIPEGIQIKSPKHYDIYTEITTEDFENILNKYSLN
ncbi:MAG: hypothetical protein GXO49_00450 [Chlorobi bacterium]|nr:hypothetical protein [Chlorobiota bacterium]